MNIIKINDVFTHGAFSVSMNKIDGVLVIQGTVKSFLYFNEITSLDSERYTITGVNVYAEAFGSDDDFIVSNFTAKDIKVKELHQSRIDEMAANAEKNEGNEI